MLLLFYPWRDPDEAITGGSSERLGIWRFVEQHYPGSRRLFGRRETIHSNPVVESLLSILHLHRLLITALFSRARGYFMLYPAFPFAAPLTNKSFFAAAWFYVCLRAIATLKGVRIGIRVHDLPRWAVGSAIDSWRTPARPEFMRLLEGIVLRLADRIWTTSDAEGRIIVEEFKLAPGKVSTSTNGCIRADARASVPPDGSFRFVYSGALQKEKGIQDMIEAFLRIPRDDVELYLTGAQGEWLKGSYDDRRLKLLGLVKTTEDVIGVVKSCDVAIIPYPRHRFNDVMFPTKLALYVVCEVPVLSTDLVETSRVIRENGIGLSCPAEEMQKYMEMLASRRDLLREFGDNCRRIKEDFYWDTILRKAFCQLVG
ncbi:MAG: glycosyltransferase [Candidatus Eisenbacteria bacterium]